MASSRSAMDACVRRPGVIAMLAVFVTLLSRADCQANAKVLGGHQANLRYYSHQVAVIVKKGADEVSCGGSILSNLYVLTAAHCMALAGFGPGESAVPIDSQITVRYGNEDWLLGSTAAVERVWVHQEYDSTANGTLKKHDVAVLRVSSQNPIAYSKRARPIKLAPKDDKLTLGADVTIAGWGLGSPKASGVATPARSLKATTVNTIPQMCGLDTVWGSDFEPSSMLCAGCDTALADACDGDDGGALTTTSSSGGCAVVVGVASVSVCGQSTLKPSVYTRIAPYVAWIESIVGHPVRSTYEISPRTDCDKCVNPSNPPPCGNAPSTIDKFRCHLEGELAQSLTLSFGGGTRCNNGKTHFKAEFTGAKLPAVANLTRGVVYLFSATNTGTEVLYMHGKTINTPLSAPITRLGMARYSPKAKGWVFEIDGCSTTGTTYAALYRSRGSYGHFQISLPIN
ncbi:hypothetical protein CBR_g50070 [Chara braunii]|uniref:Peptidase S1 domain-containing protein n=1 Tax=Chara braunii TaxID=69332 RepID=A0A388M616_CHABU|nr:hypothetical protein CBR_g50070 [Chara braunii]|eukprot:GBG89980.1 hypothetical protein CBR_g50070 [Chara braunii]